VTDGGPIEQRTGQGAALLELVAVMDRLRGPGGCPWDAEQTHASLAGYLLEEAHEAVEAIDHGDLDALREELGDVLLQVVFHARVAQEQPEGWDVDDVARGIIAKLIRRHPHVFADVTVSGASEVEANWDAIKQAEKQRESILDGVPVALPALARAAKLVGRADKAGLDVAVPGSGSIGDRLLALAAEAQRAGFDPEAELRGALTAWGEAVRAAEQQRRS
jgi:XTP/dITP diphosphohydrolase